jgi:hypothetical protein
VTVSGGGAAGAYDGSGAAGGVADADDEKIHAPPAMLGLQSVLYVPVLCLCILC